MMISETSCFGTHNARGGVSLKTGRGGVATNTSGGTQAKDLRPPVPYRCMGAEGDRVWRNLSLCRSREPFKCHSHYRPRWSSGALFHTSVWKFHSPAALPRPLPPHTRFFDCAAVQTHDRGEGVFFDTRINATKFR